MQKLNVLLQARLFFFCLLFKKPAYYTAGNQDEKCSKFLDYHG